MQFAGRKLVLERLIYVLLTLYAIFASELGADDERLEMLAIAIKFKVVTGHPGKNELFDLFGMHRVQALNFQPCFSNPSVNSDTAAKQATTTIRLSSGATSETPKKPKRKPSIM